MQSRPRLTTADQIATPPPRPGGSGRPGGDARPGPSEEDKAKRKERVEKAKDALARSNGLKGDHVIAGRAALKLFLRELNAPKQPSDEQFEAILEAPFRAPPKKKTGGSFGGFGGRG